MDPGKLKNFLFYFQILPVFFFGGGEIVLVFFSFRCYVSSLHKKGFFKLATLSSAMEFLEFFSQRTYFPQSSGGVPLTTSPPKLARQGGREKPFFFPPGVFG